MSYHQQTLPARYTGTRGPLFWLAFKTAFLTLITLGIYRFWQKTRLRRYVWSSVDLSGDRFEYTGTGLEKFLGFLLAIVFLAVYLGLLQLLLFFVGLNVFVDPETATPTQILRQVIAIYISFFAVLPFILFAVYRARRYKLARTRWRGIRFGMMKNPWGYVWRALVFGLVAILSLGILAPLATFTLEKYLTERSFYGDTRFQQGGSWLDLYRPFIHFPIAAAILLVAAVLAVAELFIPAAVLGGIGYIWIFFAALHYAVQSFAYLTNHKRLGDVRFRAEPRTGRVLGIYLLGGFILGLLFFVVFGGIAGLTALTADAFTGQPPLAVIIVSALVGAVFLVASQGLGLILITQPVIAHYVETIDVLNAGALDQIQQRAAASGVDAEGFADALDVGGAL